jgi:hypothetical protein
VLLGSGPRTASRITSNRKGKHEAAKAGSGSLQQGRFQEPAIDQFFPNTGRIWTFDQGELEGGYVIDFDGTKMTWLGEMVAKDTVAHFTGPRYVPTLLYRLTKWTWHAAEAVV